MSREVRLQKVDSLLKDEYTNEEIIEMIVEEFGVTEATVKKDIESLSDATPEPAKKVNLGPPANPQLEIGWITPEEYKVPEGEEKSVHAQIEKTRFDRGYKKSKPSIQKFDPMAWRHFLRNASGLGYDYVRCLHAPEGSPWTLEEFNEMTSKKN